MYAYILMWALIVSPGRTKRTVVVHDILLLDFRLRALAMSIIAFDDRLPSLRVSLLLPPYPNIPNIPQYSRPLSLSVTQTSM